MARQCLCGRGRLGSIDVFASRNGSQAPVPAMQVWWSGIEPFGEIAEIAERILAPDERARAARFRLEADRRRFVAGRVMLRQVIARHTGQQPSELEFQYTSYGKPRLVSSTAGIDFSLSHSQKVVLLALSQQGRIGVDIERLQPMPDMEHVANAAFSRAEMHALMSLCPELRLIGFFNCWTRKEAYVKALGGGLGIPLHMFDVSLVPGEPAALLSNRQDPQEVDRWTLFPVNIADGYVGSLAVERKGFPLPVEFVQYGRDLLRDSCLDS